jgi:hypothetical protein
MRRCMLRGGGLLMCDLVRVYRIALGDVDKLLAAQGCDGCG